MVLRSQRGIRLLMISMRMCSLAMRVHGEQSRNTMLNKTHCSSSQELDEALKTLRMMALTAETITAARMSQATRLPSQVLTASTPRAAGSNALITASMAATASPASAGRTIGIICLSRAPARSRGRAHNLNPIRVAGVNDEIRQFLLRRFQSVAGGPAGPRRGEVPPPQGAHDEDQHGRRAACRPLQGADDRGGESVRQGRGHRGVGDDRLAGDPAEQGGAEPNQDRE